METTDQIEKAALYEVAAKSFADYLGFPSFQDYLQRTSYFSANLSENRMMESHLGDLFYSPVAGLPYDVFVEALFSDVTASEESNLRRFFARESLMDLFRQGESYAGADGDCETRNGQARLQVSCTLTEKSDGIHGLFLVNDISGLYDPHSLARKYAEYDPLTRLFSRHAADSYAKEYFNLHSDDPAAVVLLEVDRFKDFNDRYGYYVGDLVLKTIARELETAFGSDAVIGRNAGQEFLILMKDRTEEEVEETVKSFSASSHVLEYDGESYPYSLSIGYCLYPSQGILYHDLARKADKAKYNVKLGGGGGYCKFEHEMLELNNF